MQSRIEKSVARYLAITLAPECGEVFKAIRAKRNGWIKMPERLEQARKSSGLGDTYVSLYDAEPRINYCLIKAIFLESTSEQLKQFDNAFADVSEVEKLTITKNFNDDLPIENIRKEIEDVLSQLKEAPEITQEEFDALSEEEKISFIHRVQFFLAFFYATFFNSIALMVHKQKLTTLVPLALRGDKTAFCKAVQVDRNLLIGHPYFQSTYARLQTGDDSNFLNDVLIHIKRSPIQNKIKYPTLYSLFATLDSFGWLDDFTASEILDMCDEARLDRYQNRIEDENYLIKRRLEYRKNQKIGF